MRRRAAAAGRGAAIRRWIARLLCVALLLAGAFHAGHAHAGDVHVEHAALGAAFDLDGASGESDGGLAAADWCVLGPGCALSAAELSPAEPALLLDAAVYPTGVRLLIGLSNLPNPQPPRAPRA